MTNLFTIKQFHSELTNERVELNRKYSQYDYDMTISVAMTKVDKEYKILLSINNFVHTLRAKDILVLQLTFDIYKDLMSSTNDYKEFMHNVFNDIITELTPYFSN